MAEEILALLMYGYDLLATPTLRKWNLSYEGWLYQNGLLQRMHYLEKQKLLLREGKKGAWVYRLTKAGREKALGGREPEARWKRNWDGWWRQIVFDLPADRQRERRALIRWFRQHGFGYLQDSVWISPDPVSELVAAVRSFSNDAGAFLILESRCAEGFSDDGLVRGAWPFAAINQSYELYQRFAASFEKRLCHEKLHPRDLFALLREERRLWLEGFDADPLLPMQLWPSGYEGQRAWSARRTLLRAFSRHGLSRDTRPQRLK